MVIRCYREDLDKNVSILARELKRVLSRSNFGMLVPAKVEIEKQNEEVVSFKLLLLSTDGSMTMSSTDYNIDTGALDGVMLMNGCPASLGLISGAVDLIEREDLGSLIIDMWSEGYNLGSKLIDYDVNTLSLLYNDNEESSNLDLINEKILQRFCYVPELRVCKLEKNLFNENVVVIYGDIGRKERIIVSLNESVPAGNEYEKKFYNLILLMRSFDICWSKLYLSNGKAVRLE